MLKYILIKDSKVNNIIVADERFIDFIKNDYEAIFHESDVPPYVTIGYSVLVNDDESVSFIVPVEQAPVENFIDAELIQGELE
jgi:hypothetical protein